MRVLITGAAGFIGHHVAIYLNKKGYNVLGLDNLKNGVNANKLTDSGIKLEVLDVLSNKATEVIKSFRPDVIIHASALTNVDLSFAKPISYMKVNCLSTIKIAKLSKRVVFLSSASVYGDPKFLPINEDHPLNPISPYGASKVCAELSLKTINEDSVVLRLFNVYGIGQNPSYAGVITKFLERLREGKPLIIYGDGEQTRDFINIRDVVRAIDAIIEKGAKGVFNVGTGKPVKIKDLAKMIVEIFGTKVGLIYKPKRRGDINNSYADIKKIRDETDWIPQIELKDGIIELINYYISRRA
jgi:UDP-glucose 4-epimerase